MSSFVRVRQALGDSDFCRKLRGKIPKDVFNIPDDLLNKKCYYPVTLLKDIDSSYSLLGVITEQMLQEDIDNITTKTLNRISGELAGIVISQKTLNLATTQRYLENIINTKKQIDNVEPSHNREYNKLIRYNGCNIEGHPDIVCGSSILEVKTSGQIKTSWTQFILQLFCYAALCPSANTVYLVLPLSEYIWTWDVKNNWPKRALFLEVLKGYGIEPEDKPKADPKFIHNIFSGFPIGSHIEKKTSLVATLKGLPGHIPFQIFFTRSTKMTLKDEDIAAAFEIIDKKSIKLYIHSPYLLNLCSESSSHYVIDCLKKHLDSAVALGARGVVVHVGKICGGDLNKGLEIMKMNILKCLDSASRSCPLLLETPAGQGTEVLTNLKDFMKFVDEIQDERFGICIDTCHIFAAGADPLEYVQTILFNNEMRRRLKLIHFNDSKTKCGSCVDRHAQLGTGWIEKDQLISIAELGKRYNIPMLIE